MRIFISIAASPDKRSSAALSAYNKIVANIIKVKEGKQTSASASKLEKLTADKDKFLAELKKKGISLPREGRLLLSGASKTPKSKAKAPAGKDPSKALSEYNKLATAYNKANETYSKLKKQLSALQHGTPKFKAVRDAMQKSYTEERKADKKRKDFLEKLEKSGIELPKKGRVLTWADKAGKQMGASRKREESRPGASASSVVKTTLDEGFTTKAQLDAHIKDMNKELKTNVSVVSARKGKNGFSVELSGTKKDLKTFLEGHDLDDDVDKISNASSSTKEAKAKATSNIEALKGAKIVKAKTGKSGDLSVTRADGKSVKFNESYFHPFASGSTKTLKGIRDIVTTSVGLHTKNAAAAKARLDAGNFDRKFTKERMERDYKSSTDLAKKNKALAKFLGIQL